MFDFLNWLSGVFIIGAPTFGFVYLIQWVITRPKSCPRISCIPQPVARIEVEETEFDDWDERFIESKHSK